MNDSKSIFNVASSDVVRLLSGLPGTDKILTYLNTKEASEQINLQQLNRDVVSGTFKYPFSRANTEDNSSEFCSARHIKSNGNNAIDLFCGAGGSSAGFRLAGFNLVGALDINRAAARTHDLNFRNCKTIIGDISKLSPEEFHNLIGKPRVDVVIGSPPCQTFSTLSQGRLKSLGRDVQKDVRNYFYKSYLDYVAYFKPKFFLMENVPGFKTKYSGAIFKDLLGYLEKEMPDYKIIHTILDAQNFSVPQVRTRLFICGFRKEYSFNFPSSNTEFCRRNSSKVSVGEALSDLPVITDDWRLDRGFYSKRASTPYQKFMRAKCDIACNNICRVSNDAAKEMFCYLQPGQRFSELTESERKKIRLFDNFRSTIIRGRCRRLPIADVAWTIIAHIGMDGYEYIHPSETRTISVREAARLQSFPDDFLFSGNMREQYMQIGNAVPPLLSYAVAKEIARVIQGL